LLNDVAEKCWISLTVLKQRRRQYAVQLFHHGAAFRPF
jgi:hypothetical protein